MLKPMEHVNSLDSLIQWLELQSEKKEYDYGDPNQCLLAQYYTERLGRKAAVSVHYVFEGGMRNLFAWCFGIPRPIGTFPSRVLGEHFDWIASGLPRTCGAALQRARMVRPYTARSENEQKQKEFA